MSVVQALNKCSERMLLGPSPTNLKYLRGTGVEFLEWFRPFADVILSRLNDLSCNNRITLLTVCSYAKPYAHSFIHYGIRSALHANGLLSRVDVWHLSSAGVIPSILEETYPFVAYDWDNTDASEHDLDCLRLYIADYFRRWFLAYIAPHDRKVVPYFREDSNTYRALEALYTSEVFTLAQVEKKIAPVVPRAWSSDGSQALVTLGGFYTDPDCILLDSENLMRLMERLKRLVENNDA